MADTFQIQDYIQETQHLSLALSNLIQDTFDHIIPARMFNINIHEVFIVHPWLARLSLRKGSKPKLWAYKNAVRITKNSVPDDMFLTPVFLGVIAHEFYHLQQEVEGTFWISVWRAIINSLRGKNWHSEKFEREAIVFQSKATRYLIHRIDTINRLRRNYGLQNI